MSTVWRRVATFASHLAHHRKDDPLQVGDHLLQIGMHFLKAGGHPLYFGSYSLQAVGSTEENVHRLATSGYVCKLPGAFS